jgi:Leucine-rich repeat (LRR) protein
MNQLTLHVYNITGTLITIKCDNTITIKDLKKIIAERIGDNCKHYYFSLIYNNVELDDNEFCNTLLKDNSKLFYMMRLNLEREILLEIKQKMGFDLNWNRNIELSQWERIGIHDNNSKFKVKYLDLNFLNLTGKIPTEIGQLVNLNDLFLDTNKLTGKIPTEIGQLVNLNELFLYNNKLTGKIPTEIGQLVNLNTLSLDHNKLTGKIPTEIVQLVNLNDLSLNDNKLTGKIPTEIGQLVNLNQLYLHNNQLTGKIPTEIGQLVKLNLLSLYDNKLTGEIPTEIGQLVNLKFL